MKENKPRTADLLEKWLLIIGGDTEMIEKCKKEEGEIKDAIEQLEEMSADEKEREIYEQREKSRLIYNTEMNAARRKGLEEGERRGKEIGRKEQSIEIAKNLLDKNIDIEVIMETTGITKEELESLRNK